MGKDLPELGLVLGAVVPEVLATLLGTLIPVDLAVLMFPLELFFRTQTSCVREWVQTEPRP